MILVTEDRRRISKDVAGSDNLRDAVLIARLIINRALRFPLGSTAKVSPHYFVSGQQHHQQRGPDFKLFSTMPLSCWVKSEAVQYSGTSFHPVYGNGVSDAIDTIFPAVLCIDGFHSI